MPIRSGTNVAGAYGAPLGVNAGLNDQVLIEVVNGSGGTLQQGDVVVFDVTAAGLPTAPADGGRLATTTTSATNVRVAGVVSDGGAATNTTTIPAGGVMTVCVRGVARVNIGANTVAAADPIGTHTVAKQAATVAAGASVAAEHALLGGIFGVALESQAAKDANNCIRAKIGVTL